MVAGLVGKQIVEIRDKTPGLTKNPSISLGWQVGDHTVSDFAQNPLCHYFMLARVSWTAIQKKIAVKGTLANKMAVVVVLPNSGCPDDNSNTQPTAAIAAMQERSRSIPLLGVIKHSPSM
jgi:hypothetical protein